MDNMAIVGVRILAELLCILGVLGAMVGYACGLQRESLSFGLTCLIVAWNVRPDIEQVSAYAEFQQQRTAKRQQQA